ncbi:MAG: M28 family peptidase [Planctomycetes bacterium]|nr:M28 family peptidase [Planctomycetota bacterium]
MIRMPGESHSGPLPPLTETQAALAAALGRDVARLAGELGERNVQARPEALDEAAAWIEAELAAAGYAVHREPFEVPGHTCWNLEAARVGSAEVVVVGAHYDSVGGSPGADDNGTGVAALLALARAFAGRRTERTLRLVAFANEEPPWFQTAEMGSRVYAAACRARGDRVVAMLSLETLGYFSDEEGSQAYPFPLSAFYPSTGDFIAFVGNVASRRLVRQTVRAFRAHAQFPSEGAALPGFIPGVGWSDQWSFWEEGYPGIMVTDTAPFRNPRYHTAADTPEGVDHDRLARVVEGLVRVVEDLVVEKK